MSLNFSQKWIASNIFLVFQKILQESWSNQSKFQKTSFCLVENIILNDVIQFLVLDIQQPFSVKMVVIALPVCVITSFAYQYM